MGKKNDRHVKVGERTLVPGFPEALVAVADWLGALRPDRPAKVEGNWVWVKPAPGDGDFETALRRAGFKRSTARTGCWFHIGLRWRPGDAVRLPATGAVVLPFGPLGEHMKPGRKPTLGWRRTAMERARGVRARFKTIEGDVLVTVDWTVRDWELATALSELVVPRLENWGCAGFTLKAWRVVPPFPADLTAKVIADIGPDALTLAAMKGRRRVDAAAPLRSADLKERERALRAQLEAAVHGPGLSLEERARAELAALLRWPVKGERLARKTVAALLAAPELVLPKDLPKTVAELEARTGRTPTLR